MNYLNEAFTQLNLLTEEEFNMTDKDAIEDIRATLDSPADASVDIIDVDADNVDELKDNYVGKVVLDCNVCHSKIYKDPTEVTLSEDGESANEGEECPFCYTSDGFKVVGQIAPFGPEDEGDVKVDVDVETEDEVDDEFMESLKSKISSMNEAEMSDEDKRDNQILRRIYNKTQRRANAALTPEENAVLDKYGLVRSTFNKDVVLPGKNNLHSYSVTSPAGYFAGGVDVNDDRVNMVDRARKLPKRQAVRDDIYDSQFNHTDTTSEHDPRGYKPTFQRRMNQAQSFKMPRFAMKDAIRDREFAQRQLDTAEAEYQDKIAKAKADYERRIRSAENSKEYAQKNAPRMLDAANKEINKLLKKEDMDESLEQVTVTNDAGSLTVTNDTDTNSVTVSSQATVIPVSAEVEDKIVTDSNPEPEVDDVEDVEDFDIDDFDEESFDELGESYLTRIYENVDKYSTSKVSQDGNKVIIEGNITFKSGNVKPTQFMFESRINNDGKVRLLGENKQISRGKKTFTLSGSLTDKKFVCESLNYNYRGKNEGSDKSVRIYGTIKRG